MDGYRHGIQGPLLDYTMKKFKGHRCIDGGSSHAIKVQFETSREESGSSRKAMNCFHGISFFTALLCACLILVFCCYLVHFLHCCSWLNYNLQERQSTVLTWVLLTAHHLLRFMVIFRLFWAALGKLMSTEVFSRLNTTVDKEKTGNFRWRIPAEVAAFRVKTRPTVVSDADGFQTPVCACLPIPQTSNILNKSGIPPLRSCWLYILAPERVLWVIFDPLFSTKVDDFF